MRIGRDRIQRPGVVVKRGLLVDRRRIVHGADVVRDHHAEALRYQRFHLAADPKKQCGLEFAHAAAHAPNLSISCRNSDRERQSASVFPSPSACSSMMYGSSIQALRPWPCWISRTGSGAGAEIAPGFASFGFAFYFTRTPPPPLPRDTP